MENTQMSEQERDQIVVDRDWARKLAEYHGRNAPIGSESFERARHVLGLLAELERVEVVASEALSDLSRLANARGLHADEYRALAKDAAESHRESSGKALEIVARYQRRADQAEAALAREREKTIEALAAVYLEAPLLVATICDEELDRSGALLGHVRTAVSSERVSS